jgi:hypothetical protein
MNISMKKYLNKEALTGKAAKAVLGTTALASMLFLAYSYAPIVKVGAHSTTYTYADVKEVYSFSHKIAGISAPKAATSTLDNVFQSLMMAGIENEILAARKIPQANHNKVTDEILAQSPYGGVLAKEKEKLGDERFYKLFIMPILADKTFGNYYAMKDANRPVAEAAMKVAQQSGLPAAAEKAGVQVKRSAIPIDNNTAAFAAEAKKSVGIVFAKLVEDSSGYAIVAPIEVNDTQVIADVVYVPRQSVIAFIEAELKDAKVPVVDNYYSWFRVARLRESGGVLAAAAAKGKE